MSPSDCARLEGRSAVVTGSASGIGRAIAVRFAEHGADVVVNTSRRVDEALETVYLVEQAGARARFVQGDVAEESTVVALVAAAERDFGRLDIYVNNAAVVFPAAVTEASEASWDRTVDVILKAAFWSAKHAFPVMRRQGRGVMLNVSTVHSGPVTRPAWPAYVAAKGALNALGRQLALEYGRHGIRVNTISPASIGRDDAEMDDTLRRRIDAYPLGRLGRVTDVANAALFLASGEAAFITGADLVVDGGMTCQSPEVPVHDPTRAVLDLQPLTYADKAS